MPWNENSGGGGGPWGSGGGNNNNNNPWGQGPNRGGRGPGGGNNQEPDLEELVQQLQNWLNGLFGGGGKSNGTGTKKGGGGGAFGLIFALVAVVWSLWPGNFWYQVDAVENGLVLRFGEYERTSRPGLHFKLPAPIERLEIIDATRIQETSVGDIPQERSMLTRDENIVDLQFTVQWRVDHQNAYSDAGVRDFAFNVREPAETMKMVAESAMREVVGQTNLQPLLGQERTAITALTQETLQEILNEYGAGIVVTEVQLGDARVPEAVRQAFEDVAAARQDEDRLIAAANQYRNQVTNQAEGQFNRIVEDARAYQVRVVDTARGESDRFTAIAAEYAQAEDITRQRLYLETMERVLGRSNLLLLDQENGTGAIPYLSLDQLNRNREQGNNR